MLKQKFQIGDKVTTPLAKENGDTNGKMCGIYACPKCNTVIYTNDITYINKRKQKYKEQMKHR